ncbi:MAG: large conductance mechanosensitive channel protein MscL [Saprospiraceae bacterium]|nr:large conductance mechanosensitive channel protein MscL [Saprospiraceae bacterium]MCB9320819.1 large conductance mechanosensitive channel protein MscL [Lewinellaceae bacterium]
MLKEFKEFALKGNMMDLAIGFILGAAFGTVVTSLTNDILMPIVSGIFGSPDFSNLFMVLKEPANMTDVNMASADAVREAGGAVLAYGKFINAIISFLLVAWALFFVVKGLNKMKKKEEVAAPAPPPGPTVEDLLTDIRDALKKS